MNYGLDIKDKKDLVGICYSTWFNPIVRENGPAPKNIAEILAGRDTWGQVGQFHFWSEPALGYYRSDDRKIIRRHMELLQAAGIDFIILDNTNASPNWDTGKPGDYWDEMLRRPVQALLDTMLEMRSEGIQTPYVVSWNKTEPEFGYAVCDKLYAEHFSRPEYKDLLVYWGDKLFTITTKLTDDPPKYTEVRKMWGLVRNLAPCEWSFLSHENKPCKDADGNNEQICVCTAAQATYMTCTDTALGRQEGRTFYRQWKNAFDARPRIVTVTWWNEWAAQRFVVDGETAFVDNYTPEFSRDIEPMKGGHGDTYYRWLTEYIRAYKAHEECPKLV